MDRWYVGAAFYVVSVIVPYLLEQAAYSRYTPHRVETQDTKAVMGYKWEYIWDIAHFTLLIYAGYKMIFRTATLDLWDGAGVAVFILGIVMRITAMRALGEFYNPGVEVKTDHQMVRSGPYRILRHPLHLGTNLQIIGMSLLAPWWLGVPAVLISLLFTVYRNRIEEGVMAKHLGAVYADYYAETWDMIDMIFWKPRR